MKTDIYLGLIGMATIINFYLFLYLGNKRKKLLTKEKQYVKLNIEKKELEGQQKALEIKVNKINDYAHKLDGFKEKVEAKIDEFNRMHDCVFYDKKNDTIVTFDNLEELGEL